MPQLKIIQPAERNSARAGGTLQRIRSIALPLYRIGVLAGIVWLIHLQQIQIRFDTQNPISVSEARPFFPAAQRLALDPSERAGLWVLDAQGNRIGYVLRTCPASDKIVGYCGPTDTLVALTPDKQNPKVLGIKVRSSLDTKQHVEDVVADEDFMGTWNGKSWDQVAGMDPKAAGIEGVSGASLTSMAIANGIRHRFQISSDAQQAAARQASRPVRFSRSDFGVIAVIFIALLFSFTRLRRFVWLRRAFQLVLIGYLGLINGQLLAQSLFAGWSASTIPWRTAPGLALLAAAAILIPWSTRRQLYCSHLCPHGAAQEWMGRAGHRWLRRIPPIPRSVDRGLRWLPPLLIALVLLITMLAVPFNLAGIEPFDAYLIRAAGLATICVAIAGLIAALFIPMAYCKYGCPTGAVLSFIRSHGKADAFTRRDIAAGALLLFAAALYHWGMPLHHLLMG